MTISVGDQFPEFNLKAVDGNSHRRGLEFYGTSANYRIINLTGEKTCPTQ